jgi:hypothetical protein
VNVAPEILSSVPTPGNASALLAAATAYAARGWSVVPLAGKKPRFAWKKFQRAAPDAGLVEEWFTRFDDITGVGVILGSASNGLGCRDFDRADAYYSWAARHPRQAFGQPTVRTARGFHVLGHVRRDDYRTFDDGELRADCRHVAALPPSLHPTGVTYAWVVPPPDGALPPLPGSLTGAGAAPESQPANKTSKPCHALQAQPCAVLAAIDATLPDGPGQRNRKLFALARRLKALRLAPAALRDVVAEWHRRALSAIRTKDFAETWADFQRAWLGVKVPHGTAAHAAYEAALAAPLPPIDGDPALGVLAAVCHNLAGPGGQFFLGVNTVAELFGVPRTTAWRWLQSLQFFGVLRLATKGSKTGRRASEYQVIAPEGEAP